jgi:XTP/dITP diphosphohydrolase
MHRKTPLDWVIASSNTGKITELNKILSSQNINLILQSDLHIADAEETGSTFVENALIKARHASNLSKLPALADDSGLIVPCLNNEPGLYSARYAKTGNAADNIKKLINNLLDLKTKNSENKDFFPAYFYCVLVLLQSPDDPSPIIAQGRWHGNIILTPKGTSGFGYDPIFFDPELKLTAAEMTLEQKQARSHRGKAIACLISQLLY